MLVSSLDWCVCLQESTCQDTSDGYYEYIWDTTLLEFIINLHSRRGEIAKKNLAVSVILHSFVNSFSKISWALKCLRFKKFTYMITFQWFADELFSSYNITMPLFVSYAISRANTKYRSNK